MTVLQAEADEQAEMRAAVRADERPGMEEQAPSGRGDGVEDALGGDDCGGTVSAPPRAFAVWWKDLHRWSVQSFFAVDWQWPSECIKPLSVAFKRRQEVVERYQSQDGPEDLPLVTLRFDGSMEPRTLRGVAGFKGALFHAHAGDVIYSKIDVRNGAIGIVPKTMPHVVVSNEFPVYRVNADIADPQFITLLFRTAAFRRTINGHDQRRKWPQACPAGAIGKGQNPSAASSRPTGHRGVLADGAGGDRGGEGPLLW